MNEAMAIGQAWIDAEALAPVGFALSLWRTTDPSTEWPDLTYGAEYRHKDGAVLTEFGATPAAAVRALIRIVELMRVPPTEDPRAAYPQKGN